MNLSRRKFLWAAPAIVAAPSLMKIKPFEPIIKPAIIAWGPYKLRVRDFPRQYVDKAYEHYNVVIQGGNLYVLNNQIDASLQSFLVRA